MYMFVISVSVVRIFVVRLLWNSHNGRFNLKIVYTPGNENNPRPSAFFDEAIIQPNTHTDK